MGEPQRVRCPKRLRADWRLPFSPGGRQRLKIKTSIAQDRDSQYVSARV